MCLRTQRNQPPPGRGDPGDLPAAWGRSRRRASAEAAGALLGGEGAGALPPRHSTRRVEPRVPVLGARSPGFGAAPSPDKWDWLGGFVAQSQGNISKASNKSPGRIRLPWLVAKEIWGFLLCSEWPSNGKPASAEPSLHLPSGVVSLGQSVDFNGRSPPVIPGRARIRLRLRERVACLLPRLGLASERRNAGTRRAREEKAQFAGARLSYV